MDDSFKFFVDQVVGQYRELKADIRTDMNEIKGSIKESKTEQIDLAARVTELEKFRSYMAGAAALAFIVAECVGKAIEYYYFK